MANINDLIKELSEATNVYRTKHYIVIQDITISVDEYDEPIVLSRDTYWQRTILRDYHYLYKFKDRKHIDGKRLHSTTYTRKYIE